MNRRRLEAEAIRDSILAVCGSLELTMGGSLLPTKNRAYVTSTANVDPIVYETNRRSIYLPVVRSALYDVFQAFDFADPSVSVGKRSPTTIAPQALFMMNSKLVAEQTKLMAGRVLADGSLTWGKRLACPQLNGDKRDACPTTCAHAAQNLRIETLNDAGRVALIYERALARPPTIQERDRCLDYIQRYTDAFLSRHAALEESRLRAWQSLCRTILASNEFFFVE